MVCGYELKIVPKNTTRFYEMVSDIIQRNMLGILKIEDLSIRKRENIFMLGLQKIVN